MAAEDDVLVRLALDISDVESATGKIDQIFKNLSTSTKSSVTTASDSFKVLTRSINETTAALKAAQTAMNAIGGRSLMGAGANASKATLDSAKAYKQAAQEAKIYAQARLDLSRTEAAATQAEITQLNALTRARRAVRQAEVEDARKSGNSIFPGVTAQDEQAMRRQAQYIRELKNDISKSGGLSSFGMAQGMTAQELREIEQLLDGVGQKIKAMPNSIFPGVTAQDEQAMRRQAQYIRELKNDIRNAGGLTSFGKAQGMGPQELREIEQLAGGVGQKINAMPAMWDRVTGSMGTHIIQWGAFTASIGAAMLAFEALQHMIRESSESQVQGVLFGAYQKSAQFTGTKTDGANQNQLLQGAISLAKQYGDEVNAVQQDVALWYKRTGDLNSALFLTNETLKFQMATGTDVEETYKTITALAGQAADMAFNKGDKKGFGLQDTPQLLQKVTSEALAMGAGLHIVNAEGKEMGANVSSASILYLHALDQDAAALKTMGYSVSDAIAINAALIQSFGNTGQSASEAADRLGRIAGGFAKLANPATVKAFEKQGVSLDELNKIFNTSGDVIGNLAKEWDHLSIPQKESISLTVAGQRQFEALQAVLESYRDGITKARKALEDHDAETHLANEMAGTFEISSRQLGAAWDGFAIIIGSIVLPALTSFVKYITTAVIPAIFNTISAIGTLQSDAMSDMKLIGDLANFNAKDKYGDHARANLGKDAKAVATSLGFGDLKKGYDFSGGQDAWNTGPVDKFGRTHAQALRDYQIKKAAYAAELRDAGQAAPLDHTPWKQAAPSLGALHNPNDLRAKAQYFSQNPNAVFDAAKAEESLRQLEHPQQVAPPGSMVGNQGSGGPKGPSDFANAKQASADVMDAIQNEISKRRDDIAAMDDQVSHQERLINMYGESKNNIATLVTEMTKRNSAIASENKYIQGQIAGLEKVRTAAAAHAAAAGTNNKEHNGWASAVNETDGKIRQLSATIRENNKLIEAGTDTVARYKNELIKKDFASDKSTATDTLKELKASKVTSFAQIGQAITAGYSTMMSDVAKMVQSREKNESRDTAAAWRDDAVATWKEEIRSFQETIRKETMDAPELGLQSMLKELGANSGIKKADLTYLETSLRLMKERNDLDQQYKDRMAKANGDQALMMQVQAWKDIRDAALQADSSAALYIDHVNKIKDSSWYKGLEDALNTATSSIGSDITNKLFGIDHSNAEITAINATIEALNNKKTTEDQYYNRVKYHSAEQVAMHNNEIMRIDEQTKALQRQAEAEKQAQQNPSLLKKVGEAFVKGFMDDLLKKMETQLLAGLTKDPQAQEIKTALEQYVQSTRQDQTTNVNNYVSATQLLIQASQNFVTAANTLSGAASTLPGSSAGQGMGPFDFIGGIGPSVGGGGGGLLGAALTLGAAAGASGMDANGGSGEIFSSGALSGLSSAWGKSSSGNSFSSFLDKLKGKQGGSLAGVGSISKYGSIAGELAGIYGGYKQGGISGGLEAGYSAFMMTGNPYIAAGAALISAFHHKDNPAAMPDKYNTTDWGQGLANVQGSGYERGDVMNANGQQFKEDPSMLQALGGKGQAQFIAAFIASNPTEAAKILTPDEIKTFTGLDTQVPITNGHDGNLQLANGQNVNWQTLISAANDASNAILNFKDAVQSTTQEALVSLNMFGGGSGFFPYTWATPGYAFPADNTGAGTGYGTPGVPGTGNGGSSNPVNPPATGGGDSSGGKGGIGGPGSGGGRGGRVSYSAHTRPVSPSGSSSITVTAAPVTVNLDGRTVARSTQAYKARSNQGGYSSVT